MAASFLNPLSWNRRFLSIALILFAVLWFGFIDTYSIYTRMQLSSEIAQMEEEIELMERKSDELEVKLEDIKNDPDLLERIARETYFMRKEGETVYRIIPSK